MDETRLLCKRSQRALWTEQVSKVTVCCGLKFFHCQSLYEVCHNRGQLLYFTFKSEHILLKCVEMKHFMDVVIIG
jgi:hypothetical protein